MDKRALRSVSRKAGCALLLVCVSQLGVSFLAIWLRDRLGLGDDAWFTLVAVLSGMTILAGALLGKRLFKEDAYRRRTHGCAPQLDSVLLIPAGAALCMAGNLVGALVEQLAGQAGIEFQGGLEPPQPQSLPGLLLLLLTVAVLPAVAEEWLLRGVILPPLRRFGDGFAVVSTAVLFALLHQNMEQAPMAFVSGLALGWAYVRSGRLAVPVAVHLWNNVAALALLSLPESAANIYALGLGLLGVLSLCIIYLRRPAPEKIIYEMPAYRRASSFFFGSVAMVLALVYFVAVIALNTKVG